MSAVQLANILFRRQRVVFVAVFVAVVAATAAVTFSLPDQYTATATLFVGENRPVSQGADAVALDEVLARTYAQLLETTQVREAVVRELPFKSSVSALSGHVDFNVVAGTHLIEISGIDEDRRRARDIANTYATVFVRNLQRSTTRASAERLRALSDQIGRLATEIAELEDKTSPKSAARLEQARSELEAARSSYVTTQQNVALQDTNVSVSTEASIPRQRSKPRPKLYMALGIVLGLILATAAALLRNLFDKRIRDEDELTALMGVPVIARIPVERTASPSALHDSYQLLRTNLQFQDIQEPGSVIAVTSPLPQDGKSSIVYNLARAIAENGNSVLAMDCDLRKPRLGAYFGVPSSEGLASMLIGVRDLPEVIHPLDEEPLVQVIPAGPAPPNPATLLSPERIDGVIERLRDDAEYILLDTPPVTAGADASSVAGVADAVIVVVDLANSRRDAVIATRDQLRRADANVVGIVLNRMQDVASTYGYYYASEHDGDGDGAPRARRREPA